MSKISSILRTMTMVVLVVAAAFMCGIRLLQTQLVDGEKYLEMTKSTYKAEQEIDAARGQIVDCNGKVLNSNKIVFNINLQRSSLVSGTENEIIYRVLTVLIKNNQEWNDSLPISKTAPYAFDETRPEAVKTMKEKLNVASYTGVEDCIFQLYKTYNVDEKYPEQMRRYIAGVRYEMTIKNFSDANVFVLASDVSEDVVPELKELATMLDGVDITQSWEREYVNGDVAAHFRGTVGAISAEEYQELKDKGYNINDTIGMSGIESAFESTLRGTRGIRTITRGSDGLMISDEVTKEPVAGKSIMLTIDADFQRLLQDLLEYHIQYLNSPHYTSKYDTNLRGKGCQAGSIVVLDVKTGGVLGMVSYPNYNLNDYVENYEEVLNQPYSPVFNRALNGVYRPGSTFKTITATAGLNEHAITTDSTITCGGVYTYYGGFKPTCLGVHGAINVSSALMYSCNIFFYETARRLGIDTLAQWAGRFGVGKDIGFDLSMSKGRMTSMELFEENGWEWYEGNVVQAGIGQSETLLTPLHLATQAMTIANKGVRYEPHVVQSVYNYDFTEKISEKATAVAEDFSGLTGMDTYMDAIHKGMKLVASTQDYFYIDGAGWVNPFDYVGVGKENVAIKTGTPEADDYEHPDAYQFNSALVGFYPADNPEIAFGVILEHGEFARVMAANIVKAYATGTINTNYDEDGQPLTAL